MAIQPTPIIPSKRASQISDAQLMKKTQELLDFVNEKAADAAEVRDSLHKIAGVLGPAIEAAQKAHNEDMTILILARRAGKLTIKP